MLIALILLCGPWWPHARAWGYGPVGFLVMIVLIILIVGLLGGATLRIPALR